MGHLPRMDRNAWKLFFPQRQLWQVMNAAIVTFPEKKEFFQLSQIWNACWSWDLWEDGKKQEREEKKENATEVRPWWKNVAKLKTEKRPIQIWVLFVLLMVQSCTGGAAHVACHGHWTAPFLDTAPHPSTRHEGTALRPRPPFTQNAEHPLERAQRTDTFTQFRSNFARVFSALR